MRADLEKPQKPNHTFFSFTDSDAATLSEPPAVRRPAGERTGGHTQCVCVCVASKRLFQPRDRTIKVKGEHASAFGRTVTQRPKR